ncbi:hypothetical protein AAFF_G00293910 [Aldrovandia affinis]|uniref:Uncharacterized protein n=1 Tax=Aldrovandia affinis TaxID=143900 RepID=A0AAD7R933_9TELE|nr:hypothetical protein AAFF_G00293910 [Aldrovandia affinis]
MRTRVKSSQAEVVIVFLLYFRLVVLKRLLRFCSATNSFCGFLSTSCQFRPWRGKRWTSPNHAQGCELISGGTCTLQASGLVTSALHVLLIQDHVLIVNLQLSVSHLEELLSQKTVAVIDVSQACAQPALTEMESSGVEKLARGILSSLRTLTDVSGQGGPVVLAVAEEQCAGWNLCSLFGILLGFPATYWFDQKRSFENCLSMVPLLVTTATASWDAVAGGSRHCFSSFSVPNVLMPETRPTLDRWTEKLQERFSQQSAFSALTLSSQTLSLPSVSL